MTLRRSPATAQRLPTRLRGRQAMSKDSGENLSHPDDVQSSLRDRIAAAIYNSSDEYSRKLMVRPDCPGASEMGGEGKPVCYLWADAVIAELGLTRVTRSERVPIHRYVTD